MVVAIHSGSVNQPAAPVADLNQVRQLTQPATGFRWSWIHSAGRAS